MEAAKKGAKILTSFGSKNFAQALNFPHLFPGYHKLKLASILEMKESECRETVDSISKSIYSYPTYKIPFVFNLINCRTGVIQRI